MFFLHLFPGWSLGLLWTFFSSMLLRCLLDVCIFSLILWLTWNFHSIMQWSNRKSLFVKSMMLVGLLLISQSRVLPSLCICVCICCLRSYMSMISCILMVSGWSAVFQGILKSQTSDLMKSTVVDESLSSFKPMYCSREYQASTKSLLGCWCFLSFWAELRCDLETLLGRLVLLSAALWSMVLYI